MDSLLDFSRQEFSGLIERLDEKANFEFIELVKLVVLAHRLNRNDEFLQDPLVDSAIVREPMYKFSKQAQENFLSISSFAFLFSWFATSDVAKAFAKEKFTDKNDEQRLVRLSKEV